MPTSVTPKPSSQSASAPSPPSVDGKPRVCCSRCRLRLAGKRTVAITLSRCTSSPAQRTTRTSITSSFRAVTSCRPEGPPEYESEVRARGSNQLFRRPPHHASTRARSVKYDRRCTGTAPRFSSTSRGGRKRRHRLLPAKDDALQRRLLACAPPRVRRGPAAQLHTLTH